MAQEQHEWAAVKHALFAQKSAAKVRNQIVKETLRSMVRAYPSLKKQPLFVRRALAEAEVARTVAFVQWNLRGPSTEEGEPTRMFELWGRFQEKSVGLAARLGLLTADEGDPLAALLGGGNRA